MSASDNVLSKREYIDRAYAETKGTDQDIYLYLIDRMWPYEDEGNNVQGQVMPRFASVRSIGGGSPVTVLTASTRTASTRTMQTHASQIAPAAPPRRRTNGRTASERSGGRGSEGMNDDAA